MYLGVLVHFISLIPRKTYFRSSQTFTNSAKLQQGNNFRCHCGLNWLQNVMDKHNYGFTVEDSDQIECDDGVSATISGADISDLSGHSQHHTRHMQLLR